MPKTKGMARTPPRGLAGGGTCKAVACEQGGWAFRNGILCAAGEEHSSWTSSPSPLQAPGTEGGKGHSEPGPLGGEE